MGDEGTYGKSEWNEQMLYSYLYFTRSAHCRAYQEEGDLTRWKATLESKMSIAMGITSPDEQKDIMKLRQELLKSYFEYASIPHKNYATHELAIAGSKLNNTLFQIESKIDSLMNLHMPFLKTTPKVDFDMF